jgi:phage/plasmid primase-like uncharacterized protein
MSLDNQEVVLNANQYGWPSILPSFGIPSECLSAQKSICPVCQKKKFRFKLNSDGSCRGICVCMGSKYLDGFALIAEINSIDNKAAFKAVAEFLGLDNKKPRNELELKKNIEAYKRRQEEAEQQRKDKLISDKDAGEAHAKAVIANCEMGEHQYFIKKGYVNHQLLINKKPYEIPYKRSNAKGEIENKIQRISIGSAIIPIYDIDNPTRIISFQFISPKVNLVTGKYPKLMLVDSVTAGFCVIHGDGKSDYVAATEGYASGLAINVSLGFKVVVLFDSNGVKSRSHHIKEIFPDKEILICGDSDESHAGQIAAHTAAFHTKSKVLIPLNVGTDWDDYRRDYGEENLCVEIRRQIKELSFKPVEIKSSLMGLSINSSILLANKKEGVSFADSLIHHTGKLCVCPISGGKAIINAGSIYSFESRQTIIPMLASLYDHDLVSQYKNLTSTEKRLKWLSHNPDNRNVYAFITTLLHRIGADIPAELFKEWLYFKSGVVASDEIINFIKCLGRSRINQSKNLIALEPKHFKNRLHLKQKDGLLEWVCAVEKAKKGDYKVIAVKAQHGQGKTQDFMKQMFLYSSGLGGAVAIAHRRKLVAQLTDAFGGTHYEDDKEFIFYAGTVKDLTCCLHSFKHEQYLNHLKKAHSIFIDEASQALKAFYTDKNIQEGLAKKFSKAAKEAQCVYLLDADLTENDIHRWAKLLEVNEDEILVITAEPPIRDFTVNLTCTASQKYYRTSIIESIHQDLLSNTPCVLAVESKATARSIYKYFKERFSDKKIILLSSGLAPGEIDPFIKNIQIEMASTDLLIHTSIIGTGVSIQHHDKRFKKGYGLFSGAILSATECLQMLRRCRDVTNWDVTFLCRPAEMFMTSFHKDIGSIELAKVLTLDDIKSSVLMEREQNKSLFIHAFRNLLEEYNIKLIENCDLPEYEIDGLMSSSEVNEEDIKELINATPCSLEKAEKARQRGYKDREEMLSSKSALLANHYKTNRIGMEEAELECIPVLRSSALTMERLVNMLRGDNGEKAKEILNSAGISLDLFKKQRLTQKNIKSLRDGIASKCAELYRLGFIKERYVKPEKIPEETPIKFIKEVLIGWGFLVERTQTRANDREYQLDINVPIPLVRRLSIDTRTDKDILRDKALKLQGEGFGYGHIAKELGLKDRFQARRLIGT